MILHPNETQQLSPTLMLYKPSPTAPFFVKKKRAGRYHLIDTLGAILADPASYTTGFPSLSVDDIHLLQELTHR
jgi:hypothetical protein